MIKLTQLINESEEKRPLSLEVKKHFLEIVSTYNKYQESMDRKSDITQVAETLGGITEAARTLAIHEGDDWFDKHTIKRNMSELDKLGKQFDKVASEAKALDQRMSGLYEDMGNVLSRYYELNETHDYGHESDDSETPEIETGEENPYQEPEQSDITEEDTKYAKFFSGALKKFGVSSPAELGDKKKEFFNYVDKNYSAENETD